jgi:chorismate--pyruvate lyase
MQEPGSLTDRLIKTQRVFDVTVLRLGEDLAAADEAARLGIEVGVAIIVRHVALTLDGQRVVMARSFCRRACPVWLPILDRGSRSLGSTLFSDDTPRERGRLEYSMIGGRHPLFTLGQHGEAASVYAARRCRFEMRGAPMVVSEVFLPRLERALVTGPD